MAEPTQQAADSRASRLVTGLSWAFAALFALSAAVQVNDPDWVPWFVFYVLATAVAVAAPRWRHGRTAAGLALAACVVWGIVILSQGLDAITWGELFGDLRMKTLNVERWRELGGLGITAVWMAVLVVARR